MNIVKQFVLSSKLKTGLLVALMACLLPMSALAQSDNRSTYGYVSDVFAKLQSHWETKATNSLLSDTVLTFVLDEDGTLHSSQLDAGANTPSGKDVLAYLKSQAPFGAFPQSMEGSQLEFKFKLTPGSMQMLSYEVRPAQKDEPVIAYASPITNQAQPASLFYTRVGAPGKVWDTPKKPSSDEVVMDEYVALVRKQVQDNWKLPQDYQFSRTIAVMMIDRDGSLLGLHLKQSSGDKVVDKAALNAISTAGAFPAVPKNAPSLPVTIEYVFDPVLTTAE